MSAICGIVQRNGARPRPLPDVHPALDIVRIQQTVQRKPPRFFRARWRQRRPAALFAAHVIRATDHA